MNRHPSASPLLEAALYLALAGAAVLLYLPGLHLMDFIMEEPRRVLVARGMLETGNFWVPTVLGQVYLNKPPLYNWLIAMASLPGGEITPLTARLPSLISLVLLTLFMLWVTRPYLSLMARLFLGCAIVLSAEFMIKTQLAEIELVFTLLVSASIWTWFHAYTAGRRGFPLWALPGLFVGLAFLTKREPALLFFYLSIVPYLLLRRELRELLTVGHALCVMTILFFVGVWLVPIISEVGFSAYLANVSSQANGVGKPWTTIGAAVNILYFPAEVWGSGLPWSLLLLALLAPAVRAQLPAEGRKELVVFAALLALLNLIPYMFFRLDLSVRYYLPMMPTVLVLAAVTFDALIAVPRETFWANSVRLTTFLLAIVATVLAVALIVGPYTRYVQGIESLPLPRVLLGMLGLGLVGLSAWSAARSSTDLRQGLLFALLALSTGFRLDDMNLARPHRALEQSRHDNAGAFVAQLRDSVPAIKQPIRMDAHMPLEIWVKAETRLLAVPGATETGPYALVETGDAPPQMSPDKCVLLKDLQYRGRSFCLISTVREIP